MCAMLCVCTWRVDCVRVSHAILEVYFRYDCAARSRQSTCTRASARESVYRVVVVVVVVVRCVVVISRRCKFHDRRTTAPVTHTTQTHTHTLDRRVCVCESAWRRTPLAVVAAGMFVHVCAYVHTLCINVCCVLHSRQQRSRDLRARRCDMWWGNVSVWYDVFGFVCVALFEHARARTLALLMT